MILLALRTRMRQGELKGLKCRSIDLVNRSVRGADDGRFDAAEEG